MGLFLPTLLGLVGQLSKPIGWTLTTLFQVLSIVCTCHKSLKEERGNDGVVTRATLLEAALPKLLDAVFPHAEAGAVAPVVASVFDLFENLRYLKPNSPTQ
jgi:hypothetical protein